MKSASNFTRRQLIRTGALVALAGTTGKIIAASSSQGVSLVLMTSDPIAATPEVLWAAKELEQSLTERGVAVLRCERIEQAKANDLCIVASGSQSPLAIRVLKASRIDVPSVPEALGIIGGHIEKRKIPWSVATTPVG
jgi:hypothetical protein